jgi:hypothetical protein
MSRVKTACEILFFCKKVQLFGNNQINDSINIIIYKMVSLFKKKYVYCLFFIGNISFCICELYFWSDEILIW